MNLSSIGDIRSEEQRKGLLFVGVECSSNFCLCLTDASGFDSVFVYIIPVFGRDTFAVRLFLKLCSVSFVFVPFYTFRKPLYLNDFFCRAEQHGVKIETLKRLL